jgi:hypothetical protein
MKRWLSLFIGGQRWRVVLVGPKSKLLVDGDGDRVAGRTWVDRCIIAICRDLNPQAREDTLLHELLHASVYVSGGWGAIQRVTAAPPAEGEDAAQAVEDDIVHPLAPVLHRLLKDLGFQFPKGISE